MDNDPYKWLTLIGLVANGRRREVNQAKSEKSEGAGRVVEEMG